MKKTFVMIVCALTIAGAKAKTELRNNIWFAKNSTELTANLRFILDTIYEKLPETNYMRAVAMGDVDSKMNIYQASDIRSARAKAIYNYYIDKGVTKESLEWINTKDNSAGLYFMTNGTYEDGDLQLRVYKAPPSREDTYTSLRNYFPENVQHFTIDPSRENQIRGEQGTIINFPENAFTCEDGSEPSGKITIELMEFYSYADLLKAGLHTMSNGAMLETGGTIHLAVKCGDNEAKLAPGVEFTMEFPVKGWYKDGMQTFNGVEEDDNLDWAATEESEYDSYDEGYWDEGDEIWYENPEQAKNDSAMDKYMLSSGELGWINCDHFYDAPETTNFVVSVDTSYHASVRMVFKNIKSVMSGYADSKGNISFINIPVGETVTLVACSIKNDTPFITNIEIRITKDGFDELRLNQTTKAGMERDLFALK